MMMTTTRKCGLTLVAGLLATAWLTWLPGCTGDDAGPQPTPNGEDNATDDKEAPPEEPPSDSDLIKQTFRTFQQAMNAAEFEQGFAAVTEAYKEDIVARLVIAAKIDREHGARHADEAIQAHAAKLDEVWHANEVEVEGDTLMLIQRVQMPHGAQLIFDQVGDPLGFVRDYAAWSLAHPDEQEAQSPFLVRGSLQQIEVDETGKRATARLPEMDRELVFEKVDSNWLIAGGR